MYVKNSNVRSLLVEKSQWKKMFLILFKIYEIIIAKVRRESRRLAEFH